MGKFIYTFIFAFILPCSAFSQWAQTSDASEIWFAERASFSASEGPLTWSGLRFAPKTVRVQLVETKSYIKKHTPSSGGLKIDTVKATLKSFDHSLREVWDIVQEDPTVIAVVPIGYLEQSSSPQIAGYLELDGTNVNPIMNAENLRNIYCVDNRNWRETEGKDLRETGQIPYTFTVSYDPSRPYQYLYPSEVVDLAELSRTPVDFETCKDKIQIGPRIHNPRKSEFAELRGTRVSRDVEVFAEMRTNYVVMSYDLNGRLSILATHAPTSLQTIATLTADRSFYSAQNHCVAGGKDPEKLSQSCEYWTSILTSFEHAGLILRQPSKAAAIIGEVDSTIGAALIIRALP